MPFRVRPSWKSSIKLVQTHGRLVARLLIGAFGSYAIAEFFGLAQSFWSVVTALVVIQANVGGTVTASVDRIVATVLGAMVGALVGVLRPLGLPEPLLLLIALLPLAFVAAVKPAYRIAPITSVIVILSGADFHPFWLGAVYRVSEILLGAVVGVVVSLLVLPSHAHRAIRRQCARATGPLADLLEVFLTERGDFRQDRLNLLNDKVRAALAAADKMAQEARREPGTRGLETGIEIRAVRRIHSDVIFVGRATADWPKQDDWPALNEAVDALEHVLRRAIESLGEAMSQGGSTGAVREIDSAIGRLIDVLEHPPQPISPKLLILPFTVQTLRRDINDFADIIAAERQERAAKG